MKTSSCRCRNLTAVVVNYCLGEAARRLRPSARCSAARRSPCLHTGDGSSVRPPARPQTCFHLNAMQFHRGTSFFFLFFFFQHTHSFLKTRRGRGRGKRGGLVDGAQTERIFFIYLFIYFSTLSATACPRRSVSSTRAH